LGVGKLRRLRRLRQIARGFAAAHPLHDGLALRRRQAALIHELAEARMREPRRHALFVHDLRHARGPGGDFFKRGQCKRRRRAGPMTFHTMPAEIVFQERVHR
jgi:hypothetical protein